MKNQITEGQGEEIAIPEDVRLFIRHVTLELQMHRLRSEDQMDKLFQYAYRMYVKYKADSQYDGQIAHLQGELQKLREERDALHCELSSGLCSAHSPPEPLTCKTCNARVVLMEANHVRIRDIAALREELEKAREENKRIDSAFRACQASSVEDANNAKRLDFIEHVFSLTRQQIDQAIHRHAARALEGEK